ncbi:MAG: hypothetical protein R3D67_12905 [Hyphomicrobiaceae bacterium]
MRLAALTVFAVLVTAPFEASAQSPVTTRIETRPFYGATVTLEAGVRVFRPLPPHDRVILNPGGATPLNLGIEEHRSVSHNYNYNSAPSASASASASSGEPGFVGTYRRGRGHHPHRRGGGHGHR